MTMKQSLSHFGKVSVLGLGAMLASTAVQAADVPFEWNPTENVKVSMHGYITGDFYSMHRGNESFGSGALDSQGFKSNLSNAYLILVGGVYDWNYAFAYNFASKGDTNQNGIIWAWLSHELGPGRVFVGQHWNFESLEEPLSMSSNMFSDRNFVSSSGLGSLSNHGQGVFYQISNPYGEGHNNMFLGAAAYGLNNTTGEGEGSETDGWGANLSARWAPVVEDDKWMQVGAAVTYNQAKRKSSLYSVTPRYSGPESLAQPFATFSKYNPTGTTQILDSDPTTTQYTLSAVGSYGRLFYLGEYGLKQFSRDRMAGDNAPEDIDVEAYSLQAGFWLTGETTPFDRRNATYGIPKPLNESGAIQLIAGIDGIKNKEVSSSQLGNTVGCMGPASANATDCAVTRYRVGMNYWANPNVRFLVQAEKSVLDLGKAGKDKPMTVSLRAQIQF